MVGQKLGSYKLIEEIGQGGMATVYKAYHETMDRYVAIKVIRVEVAADTTYIQRFAREAKVLANLQHIHILSIFDFGEQDGKLYIVMPLIQTGTLKHKLQTERLSLNDVVRIFGQLADAVDYAHEKGILHRDLKPDNVLIDDRGNVLLNDFGIARLTEATTNLTKGVIGTPIYMAPEQARGISATRQSDLYALGILLFEMLTGDVPFHGDSAVAIVMQHISGAIPSARELNPDLPPDIDGIFTRALAKQPQYRFETARDMALAIVDVLQEKLQDFAAPSVTSSQPTISSGLTRTSQKHHVFISYSRTDTVKMHDIKAKFEAHGLQTWTDEGIEVGSPSWKQALQQAIQDADVIVCLLSPDAAQSRWVREELDFADLLEKQIYLVHVRGDERDVILFGFSSSQRIDLRDDSTYLEGIDKLSNTIRSRIGLDTQMKTTPAAVVQQHRRGEYFYANRFGLYTINALEEILGRAARDDILRIANLEHLIDDLPPKNNKREFDFADYSAILAAIDEKYGMDASVGLKRSIGRATFKYGLRQYGSLVKIAKQAMKAASLSAKLKLGLPALAKIFSTYSDQETQTYDAGEYFVYTISPCPMCWGYQTDSVRCHQGQGLIQQGMEWMSDGESFKVEIETCIARGDDMGRYRIYKDPIDDE